MISQSIQGGAVMDAHPATLGKRLPPGLIVNADDWGLDADTTDRILACVRFGSVSAVSGMVFMKDSERAADLSRSHTLDTGLHLNLSTLLDAPTTAALQEHQRRLVAFLRRHRWAPVFFHPGLIRSFDYVVRAQLDEFERLHGSRPSRIDGHHHMHLSANVMFSGLLPGSTLVRRSPSRLTTEPRGVINHCYRAAIDRILTRRHRVVDLVLNLHPLSPSGRLEQIAAYTRGYCVELETHPARPDEQLFLTSTSFATIFGDQLATFHSYGY